MKSLLVTLFFLISVPTIHANTDDINLPEIASYGRGVIKDLAWHPTEDVIAVASGTGIWLYDTNFNTLGQLGDTYVDYVSWNDDGTYLASGINLECQIWETPLTSPKMFAIDDCDISTLAWYESKFAFSSFNQENLIYIYDLAISLQISIPIEVNMTKGLHWSQDGNEILVLGYAQLALLDSVTGANIASFVILNDLDANSYMSFDNSIQWDDEQLLILCSENYDFEVFYYICEWDISTNILLKHHQILYSRYFLYSNITLTSSTEVIYISPIPSPYITRILWQRENSDETFLPDISSNVDTVAYDLNPDQTKLLIGSRDGRLIIYDTVSDEVIREAQPHLYAINDVAWHPNDGRLAVLGYGLSYDTQIWQLQNGELNDTGDRIGSLVPQYVDWTATNNGSEISIWGNSNGTTVDITSYGIIDGETYESITYGEGQSSINPTYEETIPRVASNNGEREVVNDYRVNEIRVESEFTFEYQEQRVGRMIWSPDDNWLTIVLISENSQIEVSIWNTITWQQEYNYSYINDLSHLSQFGWSLDSNYLAFTTNQDNGVIVIDIHSLDKELIHIDSENATQLLWSPDSRYLMVGSRQLDFYEIASTELVASIDNNAHVYDWRADGEYLAGGNSKGTVSVWDMRSLITR